MAYGDRKDQRVAFTKAIDAVIISIDGTWKRTCIVMDISRSGARIGLSDGDSSIELAEFFLLMSTRGAVHRRCRIVRRYGNELGVIFVSGDAKR